MQPSITHHRRASFRSNFLNKMSWLFVIAIGSLCGRVILQFGSPATLRCSNVKARLEPARNRVTPQIYGHCRCLALEAADFLSTVGQTGTVSSDFDNLVLAPVVPAPFLPARRTRAAQPAHPPPRSIILTSGELRPMGTEIKLVD